MIVTTTTVAVNMRDYALYYLMCILLVSKEEKNVVEEWPLK